MEIHKTFGFMVAICVRNMEHKNSVNKCVDSIIKYHPTDKAVLVVDFTSNSELVKELVEQYSWNNYIIFENFTEHVPADMLLLYYFKKNKYFDIAICIQDSMYVRNKFENIAVDDVELLWHFTNHRVHWSEIKEPVTEFTKKYTITTHDDLIMYCINNLIESEDFKKYCNKIYFQKHRWSGSLGCCCIINYDFLCKLDDSTKIINFMSKMSNNRLRRAMESLFSLACQFCLNKEIHSSYDGLYYDGFYHNNFKGFYIQKKSFDRQ